MSDSDILMGMTAPVTVLALQAGAVALADNPQLRALNAELGKANAALATENATLKANQLPTVPPDYTVQAGDTLLKIGRRFLVQALDIQAWNKLPDTTIRPGQVLRLTAPEPEPPPLVGPPTVYSWDISNLGNDKSKSDAAKIAAHKAMLGVDNVQNVRQFSGTGVPNWNAARFAALTDKDSVLVSTLSRDRAGLAKWLAATPERFRQRKGQVRLAHGHEREADLTVGASLTDWLDGNREKADLLAASPWDTQSEDDLVKITLHFSQHHENNPATPDREQMYGGQDFGMFGEDEYSPRAMARYESAEELLGDYIRFLQQIGLPGCIPELGAERVPSDTTGAGRAAFITDVAAYIAPLRMADGTALIRFVNWWCADGFRDGARVLLHLEEHGPDSPEVAAYRALMTGA